MEPSNPSQIKRYGPPNKWDQAEYGTRCKVILDGHEDEIYVQLSLDKENPRWEPIGILQQI